MKNMNCIGMGIGLLTIAVAFLTQLTVLLAVGISTMLYFVIRFFDKAKVQYSKRHYRRYNPILFWKRGLWKPMSDVRKILITEYRADEFYRMVSGIKYQVCLMNGHGCDKIFESRSLEDALQKIGEMADKFNLTVEVKAAVQGPQSSATSSKREINKKRFTLG